MRGLLTIRFIYALYLLYLEVPIAPRRKEMLFETSEMRILRQIKVVTPKDRERSDTI